MADERGPSDAFRSNPTPSTALMPRRGRKWIPMLSAEPRLQPSRLRLHRFSLQLPFFFFFVSSVFKALRFNGFVSENFAAPPPSLRHLKGGASVGGTRRRLLCFLFSTGGSDATARLR